MKTKNKTIEEAQRGRRVEVDRDSPQDKNTNFIVKLNTQSKAARRGMKIEQNRVYFKRSGWGKK